MSECEVVNMTVRKINQTMTFSKWFTFTEKKPEMSIQINTAYCFTVDSILLFLLDETENCMFSDEGSYRSPYQFANSAYNGDVCSGCSCDDDVLTDCSGSTMYVFLYILNKIWYLTKCEFKY